MATLGVAPRREHDLEDQRGVGRRERPREHHSARQADHDVEQVQRALHARSLGEACLSCSIARSTTPWIARNASSSEFENHSVSEATRPQARGQNTFIRPVISW
jgi:hypothetical protein